MEESTLSKQSQQEQKTEEVTPDLQTNKFFESPNQALVKEEIEKFLTQTYGSSDPTFKASVDRIRSFGKGRHELLVTTESKGKSYKVKLKVTGQLTPINIIRGIVGI